MQTKCQIKAKYFLQKFLVVCVLCNDALRAAELNRDTLPSLAGALQIENSEESDQGKYECVAVNRAGTRYSAPANLYVRGKSPADGLWYCSDGQTSPARLSSPHTTTSWSLIFI